MSGLQHEIRKRDPFDLPEEEAYLNIVRTASRLGNAFARLFKAHGLGEASYNALRILRGAGPEGRTCGAIGRDLVAEVPDVTRLVDRLERAGLAERRRGDDDRRQVRIAITPKGVDTLAALDQPVRDLLRDLLGHLGADRLRTLSALLVAARRPGEPPA